MMMRYGTAITFGTLVTLALFWLMTAGNHRIAMHKARWLAYLNGLSTHGPR